MFSLKTHNILDYGLAAVLVLCPWFFGFSDIDAARAVFVTLGLSLATYSLITQYRYSLAKIVPIGVHLFMDVCLGVILMLSPSLFGYRALLTGGQNTLHFVLGLGAIALVALTRRGGSAEVTQRRPDLKRVA